MSPTIAPTMPSHYATVARAIERLSSPDGADDLDALAADAGMSPGHFQRVFTEWAGVSPKRFAQQLSLARARAALAEGASVLEASVRAGLSSPGRLHDLAVTYDALTPGELRRGAEGVVLRYGWARSPFGDALALVSPRGLCGLSFCDGDRDASLTDAAARWPRARLTRDDAAVAGLCGEVFSLGESRALRLHLRGSPWQLKVWEALMSVPPGALVSYEAIASVVGAPRAARAVGRAVAQNPVAYAIPCHRVIRASGELSGYRWGVGRKRAIVGWEGSRAALDAGVAS